jgi:hypothetical protein
LHIKSRRLEDSVTKKFGKVACEDGILFSVAGFVISDFEALEATT